MRAVVATGAWVKSKTRHVSDTWKCGSSSFIFTHPPQVRKKYAASTRNIYEFNTLDTLSTSSISDVCTAGTAYARSFDPLIILPVLAVLGPSVLVLLILSVRAAFRTPLTRVLQYTQHQQYPEYRTPQYCQHRQHRQKVSNTIHTNILYHAAASCTDTPTYSSIDSSIWSTAVVLLLGI